MRKRFNNTNGSSNSRRAEFPAALSELYDKAGRTKDADKAREAAKQLGFSFAKKASSSVTP